MPGMIRYAVLLNCLLNCLSPAIGQDQPQPAKFTVADTPTELGGQWSGRLEYLDYQSKRWFGIPATVEVELVDDGATVIRKASFDDGDSGTVCITIVSMLAPDGKTEYVGSFRADRAATLSNFSIRLDDQNSDETLDATHWTVIAETDGEDDRRPARIRETTTRIGSKLTTLKEVDYRDDEKQEWIQRNRTVMVKSDG